MRIAFLLAACSILHSQTAVRSGVYEVTLRLPADGLVAQEEMQLEYRVTDTSRVDPVMGAAPVIRAQARSVIEMPAMPGMAKLIETAHPEGVPGEYGVHPVFPHGGFEHRFGAVDVVDDGLDRAVDDVEHSHRRRQVEHDV